ncbi:hypothetical protein HSBAA_20710 [Vreelandella sulfidaeris]|uniref:Uncharacterized protein n=1 Tax=Vreelandella sulfidaeris TaxID=115553 RepID=A0A455U4D1_9GAMM|nr:hypothetical protein HSBAA_20710 [Halomonas sulfidaeris]
MMYLENGDIARLTRESITLVDRLGQPAQRQVITSSLSPNAVELGDYSHYMQKKFSSSPRH